MKKKIILLSAILLFYSQIESSMAGAIPEDMDNEKEKGNVNLSNKGINDSNINEMLNTLNNNNPKKLDLSGNNISPLGISIAVKHKVFQNLKDLDLSHNSLANGGSFALSFAEQLSTLHTLKLNGNCIKDFGVKDITDSRYLPNLQVLELSNTGIGDRALGFLASGALQKIESLNLSQNNFSYLGAMAIASFHFKPTYLNLDFTGIDDLSVQTITHSSVAQELRVLSLRGNRITDEGASQIGISQSLGKLEKLVLSRNHIGGAGIVWLVSSKTLKENLQSLDLSDNVINDDAILGLVSYVTLKKLHSLNLENAQNWCCTSLCVEKITDEGVKKIATAEALSTLTDLNISGHNITSKGILSLVESSVVQNLIKLDSSYNFIGNEGMIAISTSVNLDNLEWLNLRWNRIDKDGAKTFAHSLKGGKRYLPKITYANLTSNRFGEDGKRNLEEAKNKRNIKIDY